MNKAFTICCIAFFLYGLLVGSIGVYDAMKAQQPTPPPLCKPNTVQMCVPVPPVEWANYETIVYEKSSKCWSFRRGIVSFSICDPLPTPTPKQ